MQHLRNLPLLTPLSATLTKIRGRGLTTPVHPQTEQAPSQSRVVSHPQLLPILHASRDLLPLRPSGSSPHGSPNTDHESRPPSSHSWCSPAPSAIMSPLLPPRDEADVTGNP